MALRPYGNEIILLIKGSAVVAIITVFDLMGETRYAYLAHLRLPDLSLGGDLLSHAWSKRCAISGTGSSAA